MSYHQEQPFTVNGTVDAEGEKEKERKLQKEAKRGIHVSYHNFTLNLTDCDSYG